MSAGVSGARVLLLGLMGAGKSTVGRQITAETGWSYLDNDELVEKVTGSSARIILQAQGVAALRRAESRALRAALELPVPVVAGVAGGTVTEPEDYQRLVNADTVVWLRARHDTLVARVGAGGDRPWLPADPAAMIETMAAEREPRYAEVADLIVDVDDLSPAQIARRILDRVGALGS